MNWKEKIDNWKNEQKRIENAREEQKKRVEAESWASKRQKRYESLAKKFHCHVCNRAAESPRQKGTGFFHEVMENGPGDITHDVEDTVEDWSEPGDLTKCDICGKWTCYEHIYEGICQKCAERL